MTTLTYEDLLYIRDALVERRGTTLSASVQAAKVDDGKTSAGLMRDWNGMGDALGRVETMLEQSAYKPLTTLNAETIAALNEPRAGVAHSVEELMEALLADE